VAVVAGQDGQWRKSFPPWGEEGSASYGTPQVFFPILGPFTRHSCYPSRYMSQRIAASHLNRRDATFCPSIAELRNSFEVTYDIFDSSSNGIDAVDALLSTRLDVRNKSKVILGPNGSPASTVTAPVLSVFGIPQLSWAATSGELSNKEVYPYFSRVAVSDALTVAQLADFVERYVGLQVNLLFSDDSYASGQAANFRDGSTENMLVRSYTFPSSGGAITASNLAVLRSKLDAIRATQCRIVFCAATQQEALDIMMTAYDANMVNRPGWVWLGADGFATAPFGSDVSAMRYFSGIVYVISYSQGPAFPSFASKWAEDMPSTSTPEFFEMPICDGNVPCVSHPDFNNFNTSGQREALICTGYTPFAYDSVVFIAKVVDLLMGDPANPRLPSSFTAADWVAGFKLMTNSSNAIDCLSGEFALNENHDRVGGLVFRNLHAGRLDHEDLLSWSPRYGYQWHLGALMVWPEGFNFTITANTTRYMPTGVPPACVPGEELVDDLCEACAPGHSSTGGQAAVCIACEPGQHQELTAASACVECLPGYFAAEEATVECGPCSPGTSTSGLTGLAACFECAAGKYQPVPGQATCEECEVGMFSPQGSTGCTNCTPGTSTENRRGAGTCTPCAPGSYAREERSWSCSECPAGRYAEEAESHWCVACSNSTGWSTLRMLTVEEEDTTTVWVPYAGSSNGSSCGCVPGRRPVGVECVVCGEGLECGGMGDVSVLPGYYSDISVSIFRCTGNDAEERCAGGLPGATCSSGREGRTCSQCQSGMSPGAGGECRTCKGADYIPFVIGCVLVVLGMVVLYKVVSGQSRMKTDHASLLLVIVCGQVATVAQQLTVLNTVDLTWTQPMSALFSWVEVVGFRLEYLRVSCWAHVDVAQQYLSTLLVVLLLLALLFIIHFAFTVICHGGQFRARNNKLLGCVGTVVFAFYISIMSTVLVPLQCFEHPNGELSVIQYPSVLCSYTSSHRRMLIYGMPFLLMPLAFYSWCSWLVFQYPSKILAQDGSFMNTYAFLFSRFKSRSYWFPAVLLTRGILVACAPVLADPPAQILALQFVTMVVLVVLTSTRPWRVEPAHFLDVFITCGLLLVLCVAAFLIVSSVSPSVLSWGTFFLLVLAGLAAVAGACHACAVRYKRALKPFQFFLSHHKAASGCFVRLLKMHLVENPKVTRQVFVDADNLENLDTLFETVRSQVEIIVAVATRHLLSRPWCLGELVTAKVNEVETIPLFYHDFEMPTDLFIASCDTEMDLESLYSNGITVEAVKETMLWVRKWERMGCHLPERMWPRHWVDVSRHLASKTQTFHIEHGKVDRAASMPYEAPRLFIISDLGGEAMATSYLLNKMLNKEALHDAEVAPMLMPSGNDENEDYSIFPTMRHALVICTNGCLGNDTFLLWLTASFVKPLHLMPLLGEESFRFPVKGATFDIELAWKVEQQPGDIGNAVTCLFKEIAIHFIPLGPEKILWERTEDLMRRARGAGSKDQTRRRGRSDSMSPPGLSGVSQLSGLSVGKVTSNRWRRGDSGGSNFSNEIAPQGRQISRDDNSIESGDDRPTPVATPVKVQAAKLGDVKYPDMAYYHV